MNTFLVAIAAFAGFLVAYHTYGRWLARRIFQLDPSAEVPSCQLRDDIDYVPSKRSIVFGHHFTSIAGTGPIVGPAIAVFWGWLPALLWVVFGSIFIGAVHDFGALVVSLRNRGQTVGEIAGRLISPRTKVLFLFVLFFALTVVLAIFGLVIASIFMLYPQSVLAVWISLPIAIVVGVLVRRGTAKIVPLAIAALVLIYAAVYVGCYHWPIQLSVESPIVTWTVILLIYCAIASVLPVWLLLQPRDFINSQQLFLALGLLMVGLAVASLSGQADLFASAPATVKKADLPEGTPPIWPFLFITIACGAVSGFHCLVGSGTSSKQIANEQDAVSVGYGAMLLEGALAVVVILACCAGLGMGKFEIDKSTKEYVAVQDAEGQPVVGVAAWRSVYNPSTSWNQFNKLGPKVGAFVDGGANLIASIGVPLKLGVGIIAVLVACFAATTLDTATRLQRYVVQELGTSLRIKPLGNMYVATLFAVVLAGTVAFLPGPDGKPAGTGGLHLWPLFGATNQLLAGLAFLVTVFYLHRRSKPIWFAFIPMLIMIVFPASALIWQLFNADSGWLRHGNVMLAAIAIIALGLQFWMIVEAIIMWPRAKGVLEEALPPLNPAKPTPEGARSC